MNWRGLGHAFRIGFASTTRRLLMSLGWLLIFFVTLCSIATLLRIIPAGVLQRLSLTPDQLIWYTVLARLMMVGVGSQASEVKYEVRQGQMDVAITRPVRFWQLKLAEWLGSHLGQIIITLPVALCLAYGLTETAPPGAWLALWLISILLGSLLIQQAYLLFSYSALWVTETRQLSYILYKFMMIGGAILWPMAFYPAWLRTVVGFTPFPSMIALPASFGFGPGLKQQAETLLVQSGWVVTMTVACFAMGMIVERKIRR